MPRRRSDPQELGAVLARLERLRAGQAPSGWVPASPQPDAHESAEPRVDASAVATRRGRFDPGRHGVAVLAAIALLGALLGAWHFVAAGASSDSAASRASPAASPISPATSAAVLPVPVLSAWPTASAEPTPEPIVVDVVGKVAAPGVVELPAGSRIHDAIEAAGGALPGTDLTALDLASRLSDGQQIFVGIPVPTGPAAEAAGGVVGGAPGGPAAGAGSGGSSSSAIVNLNSATLAELETLPGVGPVLAQHILDWRAAHGRFTAVSQLQQVSGIGPSKYAALSGRVRV